VEANAKNLNKAALGSIKEAIGKVTGDTEAQAEGAAEKAAGTAHEADDDAKNKVRQNFKD